MNAQRFTKLSILLLAISINSYSLFANDFGKYQGTISADWCLDGRSMKLTKDFSYIDPDNKVWTAKKGSVVDGASIPQVAWSIVGGPFEGKYRAASVIHDIYCDSKNEPHENVHKTFYYAMRASGVDYVEAATKYIAVYIFGPTWEKNSVTVIKNCKTSYNNKNEFVNFKKIAYAIDKNNLHSNSIILMNKNEEKKNHLKSNIIFINPNNNVSSIETQIQSPYNEDQKKKFDSIISKINSNPEMKIDDIENLLKK